MRNAIVVCFVLFAFACTTRSEPNPGCQGGRGSSANDVWYVERRLNERLDRIEKKVNDVRWGCP